MSKKVHKITKYCLFKSLWCLDVLKMLNVPLVFWFPWGCPQGNNTLGYPRDLRLYPGVPLGFHSWFGSKVTLFTLLKRVSKDCNESDWCSGNCHYIRYLAYVKWMTKDMLTYFCKLKGLSHVIRSAWKWYGWTGLRIVGG